MRHSVAKCNVVSIPSTGTHTLSDILKSSGIDCKFHHFYPGLHTNYSKNKEIKREKVFSAPFLAAPVRKPEDVWVTWQTQARGGYEYFLQQWQTLNEFYLSKGNKFVVPVDTEHRDAKLQELAKALEIELIADWTPKNSHRRNDVEQIDLSAIYALPVVSDFYGEYIRE